MTESTNLASPACSSQGLPFSDPVPGASNGAASAEQNLPFPMAVVAEVKPGRHGSRLWWLAGFSLIASVALVISSQWRQGPRITIHFPDGHGLKAGDELRYRGISIGEVTDVALAPKLNGIVCTVIMDPQAQSLARRGTEFWIERPRISLSRVSGLETVVGAKYIGVRPGPADAPRARHFEGIESPPTLTESEFAQITVRFKDGYGLQTGDPVRHRGIVIGEVAAVDLDQDLTSVSVRIRLSGMARQVACEGSQFWVERPRVAIAEVRGLDTLVGGRYVAVSPGPVDGPACDAFTGLESPPAVEIPAGAVEILLHAPQRWGIDRGIPVTYRGLRVGQVHSVGLSSDGTSIEARASIEATYRSLVRQNSVFWSTGGVNVDVGFTGVQLTAETLTTIAQGGIAFATPDQPGPPIHSGQRFAYERTAQDEWTRWQPHIQSSNASVPGTQPEPQRATVRWIEKSFGFQRRYERSGWVLLLENRQLVGPADVLIPTEQPIGEVLLEVAGLQLKLEPAQCQRFDQLALVQVSTTPEGTTGWLIDQVRKLAEPEDVLILAGDQPACPVAAAHLKSQDHTWVLDGMNGLTPQWHGASVVSTTDGKLVGFVIFRRGNPKITLIEPDVVHGRQ